MKLEHGLHPNGAVDVVRAAGPPLWRGPSAVARALRCGAGLSPWRGPSVVARAFRPARPAAVRCIISPTGLQGQVGSGFFTREWWIADGVADG